MTGSRPDQPSGSDPVQDEGAEQGAPSANLPPLAITQQHLQVSRSALWCAAGGEAGPTELWVVLHGFGMLARDFLGWFRPVITPQRLVVAPEALNRYYLNRERKVGATWMTSHDRLAEIDDYVRYLDQLVDHLRAEVGEIPVEIHAFSQGAATGCRWTAFGRIRPRRLVLWGGGVPPDLDLARHGHRLSAADLTVVIGDRDRFISEEQVAAEEARIQSAGVRARLERFRGGHVIPWLLLESMAAGPPPDPAPPE